MKMLSNKVPSCEGPVIHEIGTGLGIARISGGGEKLPEKVQKHSFDGG